MKTSLNSLIEAHMERVDLSLKIEKLEKLKAYVEHRGCESRGELLCTCGLSELLSSLEDPKKR